MMGLLGHQGLSSVGISVGLGTGHGRLLVGTPTGKNRLKRPALILQDASDMPPASKAGDSGVKTVAWRGEARRNR
jgi:hypothetical protein